MATRKNRRMMSVLRHKRLRKAISGTAARPRLAIFRSNQNIYAQIIDDERGHTLAAASTVEKDVKGQKDGKTPVDVAKLIGQLIGERAKSAGIEQVVFDRGGFKYHGRVKALADAAREAGLQF